MPRLVEIYWMRRNLPLALAWLNSQTMVRRLWGGSAVWNAYAWNVNS